MPTIAVNQDELFKLLGKRLCVEGFEDLCFQFGLEFDGETKDDDGLSQYRIELPANRPDLLCVEGLARALRVFLGETASPKYSLCPTVPKETMIVRKSTGAIRPFGYAAILRGVQFDPLRYKSFIDLQDKLHQNIARRRQLVAIGTHDLDTIKGPFIYEALPPSEIKFVPLNQTIEVDGHGMMELLSTHAQLKAYLPIIRDSPVYPVIRDSKGVVLSVPPIINGDHSKISLNTKNVFIEVTAKDRTKGMIVLNILCAMFSQYCEVPFQIEPVLVEYESSHTHLPNKKMVNPTIAPTQFEASFSYIQSRVGIPNLTVDRACELLRRMMVDASISPNPVDTGDKMILCQCPITRSDVLHPCDLAEDVAVAHGFNNIPEMPFESVTEQPYMALSNQVRTELANCGYHEALTWGLCSMREGFEFLQRKWKEDDCSGSNDSYVAEVRPIRLSNPKTKEFEIVRSSLLPGLLKSLAANKAQELPLRLFEIGDIVYFDGATETRAKTRRYCAALVANNTGSGLEEVHGLLDVLLTKLALRPEYESLRDAASKAAHESGRVYTLVPTADDQAFLAERCVKIRVESENVTLGVMGVLHPAVLKAFNITLPCSVFEISLDPFLQWLPATDLYDE